jgi:putative restriction endonuclease
MFPFIANTDRNWFDFLSMRAHGRVVDEVNFWQPRATRPMKRMEPGEPVFFRLKQPTYAIAGYGFFAHFRVVSIREAWELFGWRNGDDSFQSFLRRLAGYRTDDLATLAAQRAPIGCTILRDARFLPDRRWLPWGEAQGWQPNIVQGKTETDAARASLLLQQIQADAVDRPADLLPAFEPIQVDARRLALREVVEREGQGAFRLRLLDAYGRCAISGERTEPVLDAAHIQPYLGPASNHVQNGLLLTKEFHALFDKGYVTVTPDYEVRVSGALRDDWQNGKRYYEFDRQRLRVVPAADRLKPSREALAWHGERVFLG